VCKTCGASYHIEDKRPLVEGVCDKCKGELVTRADDKPETVKNRLKVYHEQTEPLKEYYLAAGKLIVVKGQRSVEDTTAMTIAALEA
jgi:adenylate kinase